MTDDAYAPPDPQNPDLQAGADGAQQQAELTYAHPDQPPMPPGFWAQLKRWLFPSALEYHQELLAQLQDLDEMIARYPDSASNYVLRGELYLKMRRVELAYLDFEQGLALAQSQMNKSDWGLIMQTMRDRAQHGLAKAQQKMTTQQSSQSSTDSSTE